MALHDQAEELRRQVAEDSDPEDAQTYDGLKASVAAVCRDARAMRETSSLTQTISRMSDLVGYLGDICNYHDIDIPEDDDG